MARPTTRALYDVYRRRLPSLNPAGRGAAYLNTQSYGGRWFSPSSAWNTPISASAKVDVLSDGMLRVGLDGDGYGRSLGFWMAPYTVGGIKQPFHGIGLSIPYYDTPDGPWDPSFSIPIWYADAGTPPVPVRDLYGWWTTPYGQVGAEYAPPLSPVRIPPEAIAATGSDQQMLVWDLVTNTFHELYRARLYPRDYKASDTDAAPSGSPPGWYMAGGGAFSATGNGYHPFTVPRTPNASARAFGGSTAAHVIRYHEIMRGSIPHALGLVQPASANHHYAQGLGRDGVTECIASNTDGDYYAAPSREGDTHNHPEYVPDRLNMVPHGARIRMKASINVEKRVTEELDTRDEYNNPAPFYHQAAVTIGHCLQQFGAYQVDRGGAPGFACEDLPPPTLPNHKAVSWVGILHNWRTTVMWRASDFEVLSLPDPATWKTRPIPGNVPGAGQEPPPVVAPP